ncbi:MAG: site-specific integrase [Saprospiraceae bacterium]|nr:site-specific integrase [Saprospiraceae bacterium]
MADAHGVSLEMETKINLFQVKSSRNKVMGKNTLTFSDYANEYLNRVYKEKRMGTHDKVKAVLSKLNTYTNNATLNFGDIDVQVLKKYEAYLKEDLGNGINTVHSNLKIFRKLFNDAVREEIIDFQNNPFNKYKLKTEKVKMEYLTEDELKLFEDIILDNGSMLDHHRNAYVFSCYAGGIRISDILQLKWKDFDGTNITIEMYKTKEMVSVKLPNKALEIISKYKTIDLMESENYIFPFLDSTREYDEEQLYKAISSRTAYANKDLGKIVKKTELGKDISYHSSRHTWATRALRKGMRIEYVSKLLGHSSIKTTQIYAKIVNAELDKAMDVFND